MEKLPANKMSGADPSIAFSWSTHPAAAHPGKSIMGVILTGFILGAIYQFTQEAFYCLIGMVVLMASLAPFYQKTNYTIDETGVTRTLMGHKRSLKWRDIRRTIQSSNGIYVSKAKKECWNDRVGIYLLFGSHREEIVAAVKAHMEKIQIRDEGGVSH
jgi:hypothetical protein